MINDPKQIITPYAFSVHSDLLGLPLATPARRFLALLIDLAIASLLTVFGSFLVAAGTSGVFFWIAIRSKGSIWWKNLFRYSGAVVASFFVFLLSYELTDRDSKTNTNNLPPVTVNTSSTSGDSTTTKQITLAQAISEFNNSDSTIFEERIEQLALNLAQEFGIEDENDANNKELQEAFFDENFIPMLLQFKTAVEKRDSLQIDTLRQALSPIISAIELNNNSNQISKLNNRNSSLANQNDDLQELVDNPTLMRTIRATFEDLGLTFGWIGVYFILTLALFKGTTLGKKILELKVIRLNNKPIGFWYSFERFGGYAAGFATGLLGFFQIFWDPNRQAIHDKIAGTVVVDLREKNIQKFASLREELLALDKEKDVE